MRIAGPRRSPKHLGQFSTTVPVEIEPRERCVFGLSTTVPTGNQLRVEPLQRKIRRCIRRSSAARTASLIRFMVSERCSDGTAVRRTPLTSDRVICARRARPICSGLIRTRSGEFSCYWPTRACRQRRSIYRDCSPKSCAQTSVLSSRSCDDASEIDQNLGLFKYQVKRALTRIQLNGLAPRPGLEPGTCGLTVRRSTN